MPLRARFALGKEPRLSETRLRDDDGSFMFEMAILPEDLDA